MQIHNAVTSGIEIDAADCDRDEHLLDDGTEVRLYVHPALDLPLFSVTTIVNTRLDPDKDEAIQGWKDYYDGSTKRRSPHWADQMRYKQWRGTLGHWAILSKLGDLPKGDEEIEAEHGLQNWAEERPTVSNPDDFDEDLSDAPTYGTLSHYDGENAWDSCMRDVNWCIKTFKAIADEHSITTSNVRAVEQYVIDTDWNYAGQYDLLYENENGELVLADLKTSKLKDGDMGDVKHDYKLQLAAYANAVDEHVDVVESIQISPDTNNWQVVSSEDWDRSLTGLVHEWIGLADRFATTTATEIDTDDLQSS